MRKIMLIATFLGFAVSAFADGNKQAPVALPALVNIPADTRVGAVIQPAPEIAHITRIGMHMDPGSRICIIDVFVIVNGTELQLHGDTSQDNGRGVLFPVNAGIFNFPKEVEAGRFALVAQTYVILEIKGANGLALFGMFRQISRGPRLEQVLGTGWMVTRGNALYDFAQDISTLNLPDVALQSDFILVQGDANRFLNELTLAVNAPPDSLVQQNCVHCGTTNIPVAIPGRGGAVPTPYGPGNLVDPNLLGGGRRF